MNRALVIEAGFFAYVTLAGLLVPYLHHLMFYRHIPRWPVDRRAFHRQWLWLRLALLAFVSALVAGLAGFDLLTAGLFATGSWFGHSAVYRLALNSFNGKPWDYVAEANDGDDSSIDARMSQWFGEAAGEVMYAVEILLLTACVVWAAWPK